MYMYMKAPPVQTSQKHTASYLAKKTEVSRYSFMRGRYNVQCTVCEHAYMYMYIIKYMYMYVQSYM